VNFCISAGIYGQSKSIFGEREWIFDPWFSLGKVRLLLEIGIVLRNL